MNSVPIRCYLHGSQFATVDDPEVWGISATGPAPVQMIGQRLMGLGLDPNRKLSIYRGGVHIGTRTIGEAARTSMEN